MKSGDIGGVTSGLQKLRSSQNKRDTETRVDHKPSSCWRLMLRVMLASTAAVVAATAFAATTTVSTLIDSDNNASSGCSVSTANGAFAGVDRVLNTVVVTEATGYRIQSINLQYCNGGALGTATVIDSSSTTLARGNGTNGATAVETYLPNLFLPAEGQKMRVGVTTLGSDGLTGGDALTLTGTGAILVDGPALIVVPTLAKMSLALTALLLALSVWYARRRGWHGMQFVVVAVFAVSMSGQLIAAIARDGFIGDWTGIAPVAVDPTGDAPAGTDITNLYSTVDRHNVYFRIDTLLNAPPTANAQSVVAIVGTPVAITLTGSDFEASPLTFSVVTQPTQGVLSGAAPNLTYTPNALATASDSFTFKVNDGVLDSADATVTITNTRAPAITSANNVIFIPTQANSFAFASNGMPTPTASFGSCSPALPSVTFTPDANGGGTLSGAPLVSEAGPHTCTFTSANGVTPNATQSFTLTVGGVPTITSAATLVNANEGVAYSHSVTATALAGFPITGMATTGTLPAGLTLGAPAGLGTTAANANFAGTPAACSRGTYSSFAFTATNSIGTETQNATLTVLGVDAAPSFAVSGNQTVNEDVTAQSVASFLTGISPGPACESAQTVSFAVTNTNATTALFAVAPSISPTGTLTYTLAANASGTATFSIIATDTGSTANGGVNVSAAQNFSIIINSVNDAPTFTKGADVTVLEDAGAQTVAGWATAISAGPVDEVAQTLTFNVTGNTNAALFSAAPAVAANGTLTFTPAANANGSATITLTLSDNGGTANGGVDTSPPQTFVINVTAVNDAPSFTAGPNQTVLEDAGVQTVSPWATAISTGPANESAQTITFQITGNTNAALFAAAPAVSPTGVLTYTPAANATGVATITLRAVDNGGTANGGVDASPAQTFTITVNGINDAPSFGSGGNVSVAKSAAPSPYGQMWATSVSAGPADEAGQLLTFSVTGNTNPALFSVAPAVSASGVLSFTPVVNAFGIASVTLQLQDNGGTANGGVDTSAPQTFTIEVTSPPVYTSPDTAVFPLNQLATFNITTLSQPGVTAIVLTNAANSGACVLPAGVTFSYVSGNNATLTGTATTNTPVDCTVTATNAVGPTTQLLHIIPGTPPTAEDDALTVLNGATLTANIYVANPTNPDDLGVPLSVVTSFGGGSFGGAITDNAVPAGAVGTTVPLAGGTLNIKQDGSLTLTAPNVNGTYTFLYRLTNPVGTEDAVVTIIVGTQPAITGAFSASTIVGAAYGSSVTVTGSPTPTTSVTGTLPPGITLSGSTLSGTATQVGTFTATFTATNVFPPAATTPASITVTCDTITLNPATAVALGSPFALNAAITPVNFAGVSSTGNLGGYGFVVSTGALPTGLTLSPAGVLSGTPTVGGPYTFQVTATHTTTACTGTGSYTVNVQRSVTAVNDSVSATLPAATVSDVSTGTNLIINDLPAGFPAGTIASFGPAIATAIAAGGSTALAGGTLTVNANGSWTLSNPTTPGVYTFLYRLSNSVPSTSDATVTVTLNQAPTISAISNSGFTIGTPGTGTFTVTGSPTPTLALSGCALPTGLSLVGNTITGTASIGATTVNGCVVTASNAILPNASTAPFSIAIVVPAAVVTPGADSSTFVEDGPAIAVAPALTVTSAGTTTLASATVTLTSNYVNGQDSLSFVAVPATMGNITAAAFAPASGVLALSSAGATATLAQWEAALGAVSFSNNSQNPSAASRTASFVVNNGFNNSVAVARTVAITPVNDAPTITSSATTTATEDVAYTYNATATDPDGPATPTWSLVAPTHTCGGAIGATTGTFTFTPLGPIPPPSCVIAIQVCDSGTPVACSTVQSTTVTIIAVNDPPVATNPGTLAIIAHIPITFPAGTLGGTDPDLGVVTIDTTPLAGSIAAGATVTINADGSFTFTPPPGVTGTTITGFSYRVCDNGNPAPSACSAYQNVNFSVTGPAIYYVKVAAAGSGNCTLTNECTLITGISGAINRTVFISDAATHNYPGGLTVLNDISIYGQGVVASAFDALFGITPPAVGTLAARPAINAARPTITSNANTLSVQGNNTLRGFNLSSTGGAALSGGLLGTSLTVSNMSITGGLSAMIVGGGGTLDVTFDSVTSNGGTNGIWLQAMDGTLTINGGSIQAATGFRVEFGTATITNAATITASAGQRSVNVSGKSAGTATFSGAITDNGLGIALANNTGGTINFTGPITASTGTNTAFSATGGGTVAATNGANTLTTASGTALNVANTTIGAAGLTFRSISSNGAANGIILNTTGSSGGLTVTGNSSGSCGGGVSAPTPPATAVAPVSADCTGGSILASSNAGVLLTSTSNVSLTRMRIANGSNDGIRGDRVSGFTLASSLVESNGTVGAGNLFNNLDFGQDQVGGQAVGQFVGLTGTVSITNSTIRNGALRNILVRNNDAGGGTMNLTMSGSVVTGNGDSNSDDGILIESLGSANMNATITGSVFTGHKGDHVQVAGVNSGDFNVTLRNNTLSGGHPTALGQGITINAATGVTFGGYTGSGVYDIDGNVINGAISNGVTVALGTSANTASFVGKVRNNIIGTSGVSLSCSTQANGVYIDARGNGTHTSSVTNNVVRQCFDRGILAEAGDGDSVLNLTVTGNMIEQQVAAGAREAIQTNFGITSTNVFGNVDTNVVCLQVGGAAALANTFSHGGGAPDDFRLRKRFEATVRLPGYPGGTGQDAGSLGQVVAFVQGQNTGSAGEPGSASASGGGGGYTGGAACPTPP